MSSNLTPDDFLGKLSITAGDDPDFTLQPFSKSFEKGDWVLLDEMNLAEEGALKVITDAMERGEIVLSDQSAANAATRVIKKNPRFRLFATQNPWQAGKRERMSTAFSSQFSVMNFTELPKEEWKEIVTQKLSVATSKENTSEPLLRVAENMTKFHWDARAAIEQCCTEVEAYTTITNRELLTWTDMIAMEHRLPETDEKLGSYAWLIYGCRFRANGRDIIKNLLQQQHLLPSDENTPSPSLSDKIARVREVYGELRDDNKRTMDIDVEEFWKTHFPQQPALSEETRDALEKCIGVHMEVQKTIIEPDFMMDYGVYTSFSEFWLVKWIAEALKENIFSLDWLVQLGKLGAELYCYSLRHEQAREQIMEVFVEECEVTRAAVKPTRSIVPEMPTALNDHNCQLLIDVLAALQSERPILIEGHAGSGKTCLGKAIAFLLGNQYTQVTLTTESEPSVMLGEHLPVKNDQQYTVEWRNGPLTRSFIEGTVFIVDNIGQAEAILQERINPVLESPKVLCLTEKGDTKPLCCRRLRDGQISDEPGPATGFQFIATYTPKGIASRGYDSLSKELTAALFNRFITIHVRDPGRQSNERFKETLHSILKCCLAGKDTESFQERCDLICSYCLSIREFLDKSRRSSNVFRQFVKLLDIVTILIAQFEGIDTLDALHCALIVVFVYPMKDLGQREGLLTQMECPPDALNRLELLKDVDVDPELVLTDSRKTHAQAVLLGVRTNTPVLLEGKPAVGKTALVHGLRRFRQRHHQVRMLNNSETTTLQDYFGTWMPSSSGFAFVKGILIQAMESGDWFVADEFNLAPLAVTAALMPFLEGDRVVRIPGTHIAVTVHPEFRFFATQNPFHGGKDGRKLLPITVRNRFLEVTVEDFPENEFSDIIYRRFQEQEYLGLVEEKDAKALSKLYFASAGAYNLTMRDLIKMVRRFKLFRGASKNKLSWKAVAMSMLQPMTTAEQQERLCTLLEEAFPDDAETSTGDSCMIKNIQQTESEVIFRQGPLSVSFPDFNLKNSPLWRGSHLTVKPPKVFQDKLIELAFALKAKEPVLLWGEAGFKTELIKTWLQISGMADKAQMVHLTSDSEATELIGQVQLTSFIDILDVLIITGDCILAHVDDQRPDKDELEESIENIQTSLRHLRDLVQDRKGRSGSTGHQNITSAERLPAKSAQEAPSEAVPSQHDSRNEGISNEDIHDGNSESGGSAYDEFAIDLEEQQVNDNDQPLPKAEAAKEDQHNAGPSAMNEEAEGMQTTTNVPDTEAKHESGVDSLILLELIDQLIVQAIKINDGNRPAIERLVKRLNLLVEYVSKSGFDDNLPIFLFRDGPFVKAITMKHVFVVEDYDLCPQSVTERLNSALEIDPTFSIPEDILSCEGKTTKLDIPSEGYSFIATVHLESSTKKPRLSDATKSRITQIYVPVYTFEDVLSIVREKLTLGLSSEDQKYIGDLTDMICRVHEEVTEGPFEQSSRDVRRVLRWTNFIVNHPENVNVKERCMLGARFFYLSGYSLDMQEKTLQKCFPDDYREMDLEKAQNSQNPIHTETVGNRMTVSLSGTQLSLNISLAEGQGLKEQKEDMPFCSTRTVLKNMALIFAAINTDSPLLLEGQPGIGNHLLTKLRIFH